jgi:hypothetical protein
MIENVKYFTRLMLGLGWGSGRPGGTTAAAGLVLIVLAGTAAAHGADRELAARMAAVDGLEARAEHMVIVKLINEPQCQRSKKLYKKSREIVNTGSIIRQVWTNHISSS